jgi:uncharacterized protein YunC (DUF1805 family)
MEPGERRIVSKSEGGSIVVVDTISYVNEDDRGNVIVGGSHFGKICGDQTSRFQPKGVILNDAGRGKDDAGIQGLFVLEKVGIPAATVSAMSARIGDGLSSYNEGKISFVNEPAKKMGITPGMNAKEAARRMLEQR